MTSTVENVYKRLQVFVVLIQNVPSDEIHSMDHMLLLLDDSISHAIQNKFYKYRSKII